MRWCTIQLRRTTLFLLSLILAISLASVPATAGGTALVPAWVKDGFEGAYMATSGEGIIIVAVKDKVHKIAKDGSSLWEVKSPGPVVAVAGDGLGGAWAATGNTLIRISANGTIKWTFAYDDNFLNLEPLPDGRMLAGTERGVVLVDSTGNFVWLYDPATGCDT
jgi:outer membrane protein assembly factor BamB